MHILLLEGEPYIDQSRIESYIHLEKHTLYTRDDIYKNEDIDVIMAWGNYPVNVDLLDTLPNLRYALRVGVGLDNFDVDACKERGIEVINRPGSNANAVAESALWGILSLEKQLHLAAHHISSRQSIPERSDFLGSEIESKEIAIIGMGNIGQAVTRKIQALNPSGLYFYDPYVAEHPQTNKKEYLEEIYLCADILIFTLPLLPATYHLLNSEALSQCKPTLKVINVSRGGIIDEEALYSFLKKHPQAGAYLDVWEHEPEYTSSVQQLLTLDNVIFTPHISGRTDEALDRMHYFEFLA